AIRAERLRAPVAAFGSLHVDLRLAGGQAERLLRHLQEQAEGGAGERLAVAAMTDARLLRIGLGFEADGPAMTPAVHFHAAPFSSAAERLWMRPKPATKRASRGTIFQKEKSASSKLMACSGKRASQVVLRFSNPESWF